jgi:PleD family two-component response regulator
MAQVDKALYQAKSLGRNRVVVVNEGEYPSRAITT